MAPRDAPDPRPPAPVRVRPAGRRPLVVVAAIAAFVVLALVKPWAAIPADHPVADVATDTPPAPSPLSSDTASNGPPAFVGDPGVRACGDVEAVVRGEPAAPVLGDSIVALVGASDGTYDLEEIAPGSAPAEAGSVRLTAWRIPGPPLAAFLAAPGGRRVALTFFGSAGCTDPLVLDKAGAPVVRPFTWAPIKPVVPAAWDAGGRRLAVIVADGRLAIWDAETTATLVAGRPCDGCGAIVSVAWSSDGERIAALYSRPCPAREGCSYFGLAIFDVGRAFAGSYAGWSRVDPAWLDAVQHGDRSRVLGWTTPSTILLALGQRVVDLPLDGSVGRTLPIRVSDAILSPNARQIAWAVRDGARVARVDVADVSTGATRVAWAAPSGSDQGSEAILGWSPDSGRLAIALRTQLWVSDLTRTAALVSEGVRIAAMAW